MIQLLRIFKKADNKFKINFIYQYNNMIKKVNNIFFNINFQMNVNNYINIKVKKKILSKVYQKLKVVEICNLS